MVIYWIISFLSDKEIKTFTKIKQVKNPHTNKVFSANTISVKLSDLENAGLIERKISKENIRWSIGYVITEKGLNFLKVCNITKEEFKKVLKD